MFRWAIPICFFFANPSFLCGQATASATVVNPFELVHRLPKTVSAAGTASHLPANPFDVTPHRVPGFSKSGIEKNSGGGKIIPKIRLPKGQSQSKTFLFWGLVVAFGFLTFSVAANRSIVGKSWRAFLSDNHLALSHREATGLRGSTPYYLLYANFFINAGIFAFLVTRFFKGDGFNNLTFLLLCVLSATVVFLGKHLLVATIGWLYSALAETKRYNFLIITFNCVLGLFLVPFNFLIAFARDFEPFLVFWTLGLIVVFYGYRSLRASRIGTKFLLNDQFHFLLYLCAAEIAPVLLLIKLAMLQTS